MKYTLEDVNPEWEVAFNKGKDLGLDAVDAVAFADSRVPFYKEREDKKPVLSIVKDD